MTDRIIYDRRWNGRSCIEHFESTNAGIGLGKGETRFLAAMKTARFSLYAILEIHPGAHAVLSDRLAEIRNGQPEPPLDLLDLGLSQTGMPGALLATRLLDAGGFHMTSGVSYPFSPEMESAIVKYLREKEFGYRKRRLDLPENYSLYFYRLHRRFGIEVHYQGSEED